MVGLKGVSVRSVGFIFVGFGLRVDWCLDLQYYYYLTEFVRVSLVWENVLDSDNTRWIR